MRVLAINGSPTEGNTKQLMETIIKSIGKKVDIEYIQLSTLNINFCKGCNYCEKHNQCIQKDDMKKLIADMKNTDLFIFASPAYFENVTGCFKNFIDRTNPLWFRQVLKGKKAILLSVGESSLKSVMSTIEYLGVFCKDHCIKIIGQLGVLNKDIKSNAVLNVVGKLADKIKE